jgi:asparagine synthase (glutamine-hydrolysing)
MCGICGAVALCGELAPAIRASLPAMALTLAHRGPDSEGFFIDPHAALGHRRLAIIDRAGGRQPIANEDGTSWITFNGEIYNHTDLRATLAHQGHSFRTSSDTEVVLHAYEQFGPACVTRFEGMFAFAIYDSRRRELFAARDRLGKKPFFYAVFGGALHFASEIKALRVSPAWDGSLDLESLESYFSLGYIVAPATIYRHVRKLEPAHWLKLSNGEIQTRKYWDLEAFDEDHRDETAILSDLDALLRQVVNARLESEVRPIGAFLSGGIDSGLIVSAMAELSADPPVTASLGFSDKGHNELEAAKLTATHVASRHFQRVVPPNLEDVLDSIVRAFDEPFADPSAIATFYVSQLARQHVAVVLTGDGGDETFSGYDFRYRPHSLDDRIRRFLPDQLRAALRGLSEIWPRSESLPRPLRLANRLGNLGRDSADAYYADLCFLKPAETRRLFGQAERADPRRDAVYEMVTGPYRQCPSRDPVQRAQYADLKTYLPNDILVKVDRMSMAHSLEVRCPLLDRRVVEFAFRVPVSTKMRGMQGKYLLRRLAAKRLPETILRLPKKGFTVPIGAWIRNRYSIEFETEVLAKTSEVSSVLNRSRLQQCFHAHRAGIADYSHVLWAAWMYERWSTIAKLPLTTRPVAQDLRRPQCVGLV